MCIYIYTHTHTHIHTDTHTHTHIVKLIYFADCTFTNRGLRAGLQIVDFASQLFHMVL